MESLLDQPDVALFGYQGRVAARVHEHHHTFDHTAAHLSVMGQFCQSTPQVGDVVHQDMRRARNHIACKECAGGHALHGACARVKDPVNLHNFRVYARTRVTKKARVSCCNTGRIGQLGFYQQVNVATRRFSSGGARYSCTVWCSVCVAWVVLSSSPGLAAVHLAGLPKSRVAGVRYWRKSLAAIRPCWRQARFAVEARAHAQFA